MSLGKSFMAALVAEGASSALLNYGSVDHLFKGNEVELWGFVRDFWKEYGALPSFEAIEQHTGEALGKPADPSKYFYDLMLVRHQEASIKASMKKAQEQLQPGGEGSYAALDQITKMVLQLVTEQHGNQVSDLRKAYDMIIGAYAAQNHDTDCGLQLGWPYLDTMTGGLHLTDMVSMVGRPGIGKTWQMLYCAHHGWQQAEADPQNKGESRMFVSMEMSILAIEQRLAALHAHVPFSGVKKGAMSSVGYKTMKKGLKEMQGFKAPFWIVDGNLTATVDDLYLLAKQLKPDAIFIDGAYLVKNTNEKDRYRRVADNANLIKTRIANEIAPTMCSWQFSRNVTKKKKGEEADLSDIAHTDEIGMISSIVMGVFEEETVETLKQRRVKILKGRNGETGEFVSNWDFMKMDFSEVQQTAVEDLSFV